MATHQLTHKRSFWRQLNRFKSLWVMALPGIVYLLLNNYLPMLGTIIAFKNINYAKGIWNSDWVGMKNFEYLFSTSDAFVITRNTLLYNATFIVITLIFSVALAILLNEVRGKLTKKFYQSAMLLPYFLSAVIVAYLVYSMLSSEYGLMNKVILPMFGVDPISWYNEPKYWPWISMLPVPSITELKGFRPSDITSEPLMNWRYPTDHLYTDSPEASISFVVDGRGAGLLLLCGPDSGIFEYSFDESEYTQVNLFDDWCLKAFRPVILLFPHEQDLTGKRVIVRNTALGDKRSSGTALRILKILVH